MTTAPHPWDHRTRFEAVEAALAASGVAPDARVLDLGGFPGAFGRWCAGRGRTWRFHVADVAESAMPQYTRVAPGQALPFSDGAFDAVVTIDTLEHVPPEGRAPFLADAMRVARGPVVVAAPFRSPASTAIEAALVRLHHDLTGQPHPWLAEHALYGQPDAIACFSALPVGWRVAAAEGNAPLGSWLAWHASQVARTVREEFAADHAAIDAALVGQATAGGPWYRLVVTLAPGAAGPLPALLDAHGATGAPELVALAGFMARAIASASRGSGEERGAVLAHVIDDRIARAMILLEEQAARPHPPEQRGILRRLMGGGS